ncbi:MAG TPA: aldehyde ferredoxin oxidoreductase C-terminal domain-containing protein [bacterium]|nr:aldehyde ferredoxin oxidoreductase C-terminal domain-containing protein [bacterium]
MRGVHGHYLRIDAGSGRAERVPLPDAVHRRYLGGIGLGTWLLLRESGEGYDPLSPGAPLVFAFAPLVGTALNTSAKAAVVSKSPLTERLNDAMLSSGFAVSGKGSGADALVITGTCERWSTLFVEPGSVTVRETPDLCGLDASQAAAVIQARWGEDWDVVAIGVAGEHAVPFATLTHDGRHAGRGGTGAVLGSKRLKAVAVRGAERCSPADASSLDALRRDLKQRSLGPGTEKYRTTGTLGNLLVFNRIGILPTQNFSRGQDARAESLSAEGLFEGERVERATCRDCMIGCEKRYVGPDGGTTRLEYENVFALGSLLGIWNRDTVLRASQMCDELGMDTISTGGTYAFAAECVERGLLELPGVRFGDGEGLLTVLPKIARREDEGALLALGSRALARRIGQGSEGFAAHVKGLELPGYHPGGLQTLGLGLAVGARGADHNKSGAYDLDLSGSVNRFGLDAKRVAAMIELENQAAVLDSLILCKFVRRALTDVYGDGAQMLTALTGETFTSDDLRAAGEAIHDLKKLFNQRQGWQAKEDTLPSRFYRAASNGGGAHAAPAEGEPEGIDPQAFSAARAEYYRQRGWSLEGRWQPDPDLLATLRQAG